jgi:nucleotide-binding universal stress UspA family protein
MFQNVLVGVEGRQGGRDAIALATRLLADGGRLTLVHVHGGAPRSAHATIAALATTAEQDSLAMLRRERDAAEVDAELLGFSSSSPGHGLHTLAEQRGADLIAVGSCARSALGRAMLGDDARASLNGAPCAVAIALHGYAKHPKPIVSIGVGYDESPESEQALAAAKAIAARHRSLVRALQVVTLPAYAFTGAASPAIGESIDALVSEAGARMDRLSGVNGRVVYGVPGEELAAFGEQVDLLVVGSRSHGPVRRLMLGSASNMLQRDGRCSLLVMPRTATREAASQPPAAEEASQSPAARAASEPSHAEDRTLPQAAIVPER